MKGDKKRTIECKFIFTQFLFFIDHVFICLFYLFDKERPFRSEIRRGSPCERWDLPSSRRPADGRLRAGPWGKRKCSCTDLETTSTLRHFPLLFSFSLWLAHQGREVERKPHPLAGALSAVLRNGAEHLRGAPGSSPSFRYS